MTQPKTAKVYDMTPSQLRRQVKRQSSGEARPSVFSAMADGSLAAQFFFNLAGFEFGETKFFMKIVELCGEGGRPVEVFDEKLAEHARCTDRTIRAWRAAYIARAQTINFWPLLIAEGEYDQYRQRYKPTSYSVAIADHIERAVTLARSMPEYERDRVEAVRRAAEECYDDIPDAPAQRRVRKPKKSRRSPVMQSLEKAAKNLDQGKHALDALTDRQRAALVAGQGEDLRRRLDELQAQIDNLRASISETVEEAEVDDMPEKISGIPPAESSFREDINTNTRKLPDEPEPETEHPPEAVSLFDGLCERLTKPLIQSAELVLAADSPPRVPDDNERAERAAILEFEAGLEREEAEERALDELLE